jgi:hypothetical protein
VRKKGPQVWVYRWWEEDINGKLLHRKIQVGDVKKYPTESAAHAAVDALRLTINNRCEQRSLRRTTINTLWDQVLPWIANWIQNDGEMFENLRISKSMLGTSKRRMDALLA